LRITAFALCVILIGSTAHAYEYWNDIRHSALLPGNTVNIKLENPTGAGVENFLLYANGGIFEQTMTPIADGPSTLSATVPGPATAARYYGFRLKQGGELDLMPVRIGDGVAPAPGDLTHLSADPSGDALYGYLNLDLTECRVSFSGDRLYAALKNAGGGFPVNQGLTFFGYLLGIANPAQADPDTVWGMMHTYQQAGVISPGLYRITGSGLGNLTKIGAVQVQEFPATNELLVSCLLADLLADPYFMSWYEPSDPVLGIAAFTQRITLLERRGGGRPDAGRHMFPAGVLDLARPQPAPHARKRRHPGRGLERLRASRVRGCQRTLPRSFGDRVRRELVVALVPFDARLHFDRCIPDRFRNRPPRERYVGDGGVSFQR
jgi:hypothetical protein